MRTRALLAAPAILTLTALTACGGEGEADQADQAAADCVDATDMGPAIAKGAKGPKITPDNAQAVESDAGNYYIAMAFTIEGDEETGVWISTSLNPDDTSIMSVDNMAKTVTRWPDAETQDITYPNENTDAAEACLDS